CRTGRFARIDPLVSAGNAATIACSLHTRQEPQATAVVSSEAEPRADIDLQKPPSRVFVIAAITLTLLLLAGMLSFLFYRAFTQRAPTNALIVQGDENWQGAT